MVASWAAAAACELVFEVWTWGRATEVFAEPNGTFTAQLHPGPVRVRRGGGWVPVDTTLAKRADGTLAPVAVVVPLAFSGGRAGPLVRVGGGQRRAGLYWPGRLPRPRVAGRSVTYPGCWRGWTCG